MREWFSKLADYVANRSASPWASLLALSLVVAWAATGPIFGFSDQWEAHINTVTAILTFLMVFLLQHTQARDTKAIQLKLNELLRVAEGARHENFIALGKKDERELAEIEEELQEACAVDHVGEAIARHEERVGKRDKAPLIPLNGRRRQLAE